MPSKTPEVQWLTSPGKLTGWKPFRRIHFNCPDCEDFLSMPERHAGRKGLCPACGRTLFAPDPTESKPAKMPGFSAHGSVPQPRPAKPVETPDDEPETASNESDLAYSGLLHHPGDNRTVASLEGGWNEETRNRGLGTAKIRNPLPLEIAAPWLGIAAALTLLAIGLSPYLNLGAGTDSLANTPSPKGAEDLAGQIQDIITGFNSRPPDAEQLAMLRPVDGIGDKLNNQRVRFPDGHRLKLGGVAPELGTEHYDSPRRAFVYGTTDGQRVRFVFEEVSPDRWALDWESAIGYCETDWVEFSNSPPDGSKVMRVIASKGSYFNHEFSDGASYLCVKLTDLHARAQCWGYAHVNSSVGKLLAPWLASDSAPTLTLSLEFPPLDPDHPDRPRNQVWIRDIVSSSWFVE